MLSRFWQGSKTGHRLLQGMAGVVAGGVISAGLLAGDGPTRTSFDDPLDTPAMTRTALSSRPVQSMDTVGKRIVAVGQRGFIATSDDGGQQWTQRASPVQVDLVSVRFTDDHNGWASGHDGVILHSADGGQTWTRQFDGRNGPALATWYTDNAAASADGAEYAGQIQRNFGQGPWLPMLDVHFDDAKRGLALGSFGMLITSGDGGASWQPALHHINNPDYLHLNALAKVGQATLIASERGTVFRRTGGEIFVPVATGHTGTFFSLASHGNTVLAGALRGVVYVSTDAGASWQPVSAGLKQTVSAIRWLPQRNQFALVTVGGEVALADADGGAFAPVDGVLPGIHTSVVEAEGHLIVGGMQGLQRVPSKGKATGEAP